MGKKVRVPHFYFDAGLLSYFLEEMKDYDKLTPVLHFYPERIDKNVEAEDHTAWLNVLKEYNVKFC